MVENLHFKCGSFNYYCNNFEYYIPLWNYCLMLSWWLCILRLILSCLKFLNSIFHKTSRDILLNIKNILNFLQWLSSGFRIKSQVHPVTDDTLMPGPCGPFHLFLSPTSSALGSCHTDPVFTHFFCHTKCEHCLNTFFYYWPWLKLNHLLNRKDLNRQSSSSSPFLQATTDTDDLYHIAYDAVL